MKPHAGRHHCVTFLAQAFHLVVVSRLVEDRS
jgi:hypothetical protein